LHTIAVLGAGEMGATCLQRLAAREQARRIVLVDVDESRARGKALDIAQSGPLHGFDVAVEGLAQLSAVGRLDAVVLADPAELEAAGPWAEPSDRMLSMIAAVPDHVPLVVAGPFPSPLVEAAAHRRGRRELVLGSVPLARVAAVRRQLALELEVGPREIGATVLGLPPHDLVVPASSVTVGGLPVESLSATALRRARAALSARLPGPAALAAAAVRALEALAGARPSVLPLVVRLDGEYGHRGAAVAVPVRVGGGRVQAVIEVPLEPVDRLALDAAVERRRRARS
jgi:malate dehydrogenase